jgi:hypothetical protein
MEKAKKSQGFRHKKPRKAKESQEKPMKANIFPALAFRHTAARRGRRRRLRARQVHVNKCQQMPTNGYMDGGGIRARRLAHPVAASIMPPLANAKDRLEEPP